MKLSDYIAEFLIRQGVKDIFTITGGGAMHLNDSFGHAQGLHCIYNHHEQACAIAAESYARLTGRIAAVCVTSGPGGTNAITGVLGGWLDSVPMFVVSGQVKRETTLRMTGADLRQLGDQEYDIVRCAETMTKYAVMVTEPKEIRYHLEKAWFLANNGRKGPVWLDIPLDVQASQIEPSELKGFDPAETEKEENPVYDQRYTPEILKRIRESRRPVILAGEGVRFGNAYREFRDCVDALKIPVVTAWNANDLLPDTDPCYAGRPGTVGTRGGNFVVQNADLLLVLGCRMNIRIISYNKFQFGKNAYKIMVDIDKNELDKPTVRVDLPIHADVKDVCRELSRTKPEERGDHESWLAWCREINRRYPACLPEYGKKDRPLNPYVFLQRLSEELTEGDVTCCGNGAACVQTFQTFVIKENQRLYTNSGCAAMGYGFPAAVGAAAARQGERVICVDGDGSFMMNLQELQTVVYNRMNIRIFILNNNGYHSIRQTQGNLFQPPFVGIDSDSGVSFPDFEKLAYAFGLPYKRIDTAEGLTEAVREVLSGDGPFLCEAVVDEKQNFEPKLSSKVMPDGSMTSPELDDMYPFLPEEEYQKIREEAQSI